METLQINDIDQTFINRYNKPGPRYTSYPTAPEWTEEVNHEALVNQLAALESRPGAPISLYVHIPFCHEICHFCGCHTYTLGNQDFADRYIQAVLNEFRLFASHLPKHHKQAVQLHLGGGTPTFLTVKQLDVLLSGIRSIFKFSDDAELAIELDPRVTSEEQMKLLSGHGFNRVSFGVQDFDPKVQHASNRIQSKEKTRWLYDLCREIGITSVNFDLIYGLPLQTLNGFASTIEEVIRWKPDRIALFSYAHVPWLKPYQRNIAESDLPQPMDKFQLFIQSRRLFLEAGYEQIGMDHFALPGDEISIARKQERLRRNFMGYTVRPESHVVAAGVTAISDLGSCYVQNVKKFNHYMDHTSQGVFPVYRGSLLNDDDLLRRDVIMRIMCNFTLEFAAVEKQYGISFNQHFAAELSELQTMIDDGLIAIDDKRLNVLPLGKIFVRNIAMPFDRYLKLKSQHSGPRFSKTI